MTAGDRREHFDPLPPLDDLPGPARPISEQRAADLVAAAIDRAHTPPVATAKRGSPWRMVLVAAAVLAVAGAASAGIYRLATSDDDEPEQPEVAPQPADAPAPGPGPAPEVVPRADPEPAETEEPAPLEVEAETIEPAPSEHLSEPRSDPEPSSPEDLLALANERRGDEQYKAADALYQRVMRKHAGTSAAYVATIASASLHLDHLRDGRGALKLFRKALEAKPRGYLAEEARSGIAEAYRALGNTEAEAKALQDLLDHHPDSPLRGRAQDRLRSLQ